MLIPEKYISTSALEILTADQTCPLTAEEYGCLAIRFGDRHRLYQQAVPMRNILKTAMMRPDDLVVEFEYVDAKGRRTRRVVSPIRFSGTERMLGLCLSREEPRQFYLDRCENVTLRSASDYVMPVPMQELAIAG